MHNAITSEIVVAYSQCPQTAFLLLRTEEKGTHHEYDQILQQQKLTAQHQFLTTLSQTNLDIHFYTPAALISASDAFVNANLMTEGFEAVCSMLTKVVQPSSLGEYSYEPAIVVGTHSITKEQKLELLFAGYVLEKIQGKVPEHGKIIDVDGISHHVKLGESANIILPLLRPLQTWITVSSPEPPPLLLNSHCPSCQYRDLCQARAEKEDNLSLLTAIKPKDVRYYEKKGIFTVKQLSYVYKPRRPSKRAKNLQATHKPELQALAIRTGKIYLQHIPTISRKNVELFFDIEGIPDRQLYYLIGLFICEDSTRSYRVFWADTAEDEGHMWSTFLGTVSQYPNAPLYHYGSYDSRALLTLSKRYGTEIAGLDKRLININTSLYGKVYFPVRSNGLKEIGKFLGATWTAENASGLQSLVWRHYWDETHDTQYQDLLVTYNQEDCLALKMLVDELSNIKESAQTLSHVDFIDQPKRQTTSTGEVIHNQFDTMLEFAHANYDKKKIRFRPNEEDQKPSQEQHNQSVKKGTQGHRKARPKGKKIIHVPAGEVCPHDNEPLRPTEHLSKRVIIDLVVTKNGMRKTITEYVGSQGYCAKCKRFYSPPEIRKFSSNQIYGYQFQAWLVYQRVALRMTYESIAEMVTEQFHEKMSWSYTILAIENLSISYAETEQGIIRHLLESPFLHADETPITIKGTKQYVWTFTTDKYVIFKLSKTREATIAYEFLKDYHGILITDFYSGYDSIACRQQKCWVHLIRDLNDDLWKCPFDSEYETFVSEVRNLIVSIMEAVQKYGLKKRHLQKFMQNVNAFYTKEITGKLYTSELVIKCQKRFIRYRDSLFTFLVYDGIPWHNNTAERALRHIAKQQQISMNFHEATTHHYLRLLGIRQTCRFQNKSFFRFLLSREINIDQFRGR
ncbi:MAG: TM0106 family RecB-like putative nuclease [Ktedonobacteraceae bacterium]